MIFLLAGLLFGKTMTSSVGSDEVAMVFVSYIYLHLIRAGMVALFYPVMQYGFHQQITIKECTFLTWGGLRGALSMILALSLSRNVHAGGYLITAEQADKVFFVVGGVAALTLIVNATTASHVLVALKLVVEDSEEDQIMRHYVRRRIHKRIVELLADLKYHLPAYDDSVVEMFCTIIHENVSVTSEKPSLNQNIPDDGLEISNLESNSLRRKNSVFEFLVSPDEDSAGNKSIKSTEPIGECKLSSSSNNNNINNINSDLDASKRKLFDEGHEMDSVITIPYCKNNSAIATNQPFQQQPVESNNSNTPPLVPLQPPVVIPIPTNNSNTPPLVPFQPPVVIPIPTNNSNTPPLMPLQPPVVIPIPTNNSNTPPLAPIQPYQQQPVVPIPKRNSHTPLLISDQQGNAEPENKNTVVEHDAGTVSHESSDSKTPSHEHNSNVSSGKIRARHTSSLSVLDTIRKPKPLDDYDMNKIKVVHRKSLSVIDNLPKHTKSESNLLNNFSIVYVSKENKLESNPNYLELRSPGSPHSPDKNNSSDTIGVTNKSPQFRSSSTNLLRKEVNLKLMKHVRVVFLDVLRVTYWQHINEGKIPRSSPTALNLLASLDYALSASNNDKKGLHDWEYLNRKLQSTSSWYHTAATSIDMAANGFLSLLKVCNIGKNYWHYKSELGEYVNKWHEGNCIYALSSYIDAHTQAQELVPYYIGDTEVNMFICVTIVCMFMKSF